jgi:uncharacterized membrane protein
MQSNSLTTLGCASLMATVMPISCFSPAARKDVSIAVVGLLWCAIAYYGRVFLLGEARWRFMGWNLFLAVVPFGLSFLMRYALGTWGRVLGFLPWLLFLPNAPYVATDLIHLTTKSSDSPWHDLLFLLSCSGVGMMLGYLSLRHVHEIIEQTLGLWIARASVVVLLLLSSFGIYLGRFLRWNSWDIATHPWELLGTVAGRFIQPHHHPRTWAFTLAFGAMLMLGYAFIELLRAPSRSSSSLER